MPSKLKSKKSQKKSKRSLSTACWEQNVDGTLSLTIGSKNSEILTDDTIGISSESRSNPETPEITHDFNGNDMIPVIVKSPPKMVQPTVPIKILQSNWSSNGIDYKLLLQTKRRDAMTAK